MGEEVVQPWGGNRGRKVNRSQSVRKTGSGVKQNNILDKTGGMGKYKAKTRPRQPVPNSGLNLKVLLYNPGRG